MLAAYSRMHRPKRQPGDHGVSCVIHLATTGQRQTQRISPHSSLGSSLTPLPINYSPITRTTALLTFPCIACLASSSFFKIIFNLALSPFFFYFYLFYLCVVLALPHGMWDLSSNPQLLHWKCRLSTTGPPGKSPR